MKLILALLLIITGCANADNKTENKTVLKQMKYTQLQCKQKILPVNIEYAHSPGKLNVTLQFEASISRFKITGVRGIDGLEVITAKTPHSADVNKGDTLELEADIVEPSGASFVAIDVEGMVRGQLKKQSIAVPIGEEVKEVSKFQKTSQPTSAPQLKKRKVMRLEESTP